MEEGCLGLLGWDTNNGRGVPGPIGVGHKQWKRRAWAYWGRTQTMEEACLGLLGWDTNNEEACLGLLGWDTHNGRGVPGPIGVGHKQ